MIEIKIRGYHLDVFGHVNNARYLEFLEEGRWAFFEEKANIDDLAKEGLVFTVVNINIDYRKPALLGETLCVKTRFMELGQRSAALRQTVTNKASGVIVADARVTFVMVAVAEQRAVPLEGVLGERIRKILGP